MIRKRGIVHLAAAGILWGVASGWGYTGHYKITNQAFHSLGSKVSGFNEWQSTISQHASDPDFRKAWFKDEFPKHFIDIDNYPEFLAGKSINPNYDSLAFMHGDVFVKEQGILPWATLQAFDSLKQCFTDRNFQQAKLWAINLSHYVGDGHMPLHVTNNYDGQESGNKGIHSRYESAMIIAYSDSIPRGDCSPRTIDNVRTYIFDYLYQSNRLCDSIFEADNKAKLKGDYHSTEYLNELWHNTSHLTIDQFEKASAALSNLIYTAWVKAGCPDIPREDISEPPAGKIISVTLNENGKDLTIKYQISKPDHFKIDIRNADGTPVIKAGKWDRETGNYLMNVDISQLPMANYLATLDCASYCSTVKFSTK